jgi:hypothetical protein
MLGGNMHGDRPTRRESERPAKQQIGGSRSLNRPEFRYTANNRWRRKLAAILASLLVLALCTITLHTLTDKLNGKWTTTGSKSGNGNVQTPSPVVPNNMGPSNTDLAMVHAMLTNEIAHGWDSCYNGLWINWDEVNGQTVGNWNGTGQPDQSPCTRHEDRMTTLRLLHALLLYRADTGSTEFDHEIGFIEHHVLTLFTISNPDLRGWAWNDMVDIATLSGDNQFTSIANAMLNLYYSSPAESTRPDWQIEEASDLVRSGNPTYMNKGNAELQNYWRQYYLPDVKLIMGAPIKTPSESDIAVAYARAGMTDKANLLLSGMQSDLWDSHYGGFVEGGIYTAGVVTQQTKKTGGRMMTMLALGKILGNQQLVSTMDVLFRQHIYQSSPTGYEGVLYEQQQNWSLYVLNGTTENWVTSEAMGISMVALLMK